MTNGWRCWKGRQLLTGAILAGLAALPWVGYWWATLPRTPDALFRARCSSCHELRTARVCEFAPELRPAIVKTMRLLHGADQVIDDDEAIIIARYLGDPALCLGLPDPVEGRPAAEDTR